VVGFVFVWRGGVCVVYGVRRVCVCLRMCGLFGVCSVCVRCGVCSVCVCVMCGVCVGCL